MYVLINDIFGKVNVYVTMHFKFNKSLCYNIVQFFLL